MISLIRLEQSFRLSTETGVSVPLLASPVAVPHQSGLREFKSNPCWLSFRPYDGRKTATCSIIRLAPAIMPTLFIYFFDGGFTPCSRIFTPNIGARLVLW